MKGRRAHEGPANANRIKRASGRDYENLQSLEQGLAFGEAETASDEAGSAFDEGARRPLGLFPDDDPFDNLALLLSNQCPHATMVYVFQGRGRSTLQSRCELSGSVLKQLNDAYEYIRQFNRTYSEFRGLKRIDTPDYPEKAIRRALPSIFVDRDYALDGPALINIFEDRIELAALGGSVEGASAENIDLGASMPRNKRLADVFRRLGLIEAHGTGIAKINECYEGTGMRPALRTTPNAFKVILPNLN